MIYAGIDVDLSDHEKAIAAGLAPMGLWLWAMLWLRKHRSRDGSLPARAVLASSWGGRRVNLAAAQALVKAGLWVVTDGGWMVFNYVRKNDTKEEIEARIQASRDKQQAYRDRQKGCSKNSDDTQIVTRNVTSNVTVPPGVGAGVGVVASSGEVQEGARVVSEIRTRDDGLLGMGAGAWAEGYARGSGVPCTTPGRLEEIVLPAASAAHAKGLSGSALAAWYSASAEQYARATKGNRFWPPKPSAWARWLDGGGLGAEALATKEGPKKVEERPHPGYSHPRLADELSVDEIDEVKLQQATEQRLAERRAR